MPCCNNKATPADMMDIAASTQTTVRLLSNLSEITPKHGPAMRNIQEADPVVMQDAWYVVRGAWCVVRGAWCV